MSFPARRFGLERAEGRPLDQQPRQRDSTNERHEPQEAGHEHVLVDTATYVRFSAHHDAKEQNSKQRETPDVNEMVDFPSEVQRREQPFECSRPMKKATPLSASTAP